MQKQNEYKVEEEKLICTKNLEFTTTRLSKELLLMQTVTDNQNYNQ